MKRWLPFLVSTLCASAALADPPPSAAGEPQKAATALVQQQLLNPLKKAESKRRRFSRAAPVPVERRVRVLDSVAQTDARGKRFVRFAVDVRAAWDEDGAWEKDAVVGCAYPSEQQVFVRRGERYIAARDMVGRQGEEAPSGVCAAAPQDGAHLASSRS